MLSLSSSILSGELKDKIRVASKAGFSAIEICESDLINFESPLSDIGRIISDEGLTLSAFQKFSDLEGLEGKDRVKSFDRLERKFDLLEEIGGKLLLLVSSLHPKSSAVQEILIKDLRKAGERAAKRNIYIAYLALPWAKNIRNEKDALTLVMKADHPHLGIALNSLFSLGDGSKAANLRNIPTKKIFHVQLADTPLLSPELHRISQNSLLPGQGILNLVGFTSLIARGGYQGDWSLAPINKNQTYDNHTAIDCYRALVNLLDEVSRQEPKVNFPTPTLPEKATLSGFELIEFTSAEEEKDILTDLLSSMGFRQERHHCSQEVTLWRQGSVNLLITKPYSESVQNTFLRHGTYVSNLGLRVKDANNTVDRAAALGAKVIHEIPGAGEIALPAIRGAGDHLVHFLDEKSNLHQMWEINYQPLLQKEIVAPTGIRRIDHVAQTMEYSQMQSWVLYYLSTFDMDKSSIVDVADPSGIIRSQVLTTSEGEVRLNLNSSQSKHTLAGSFLSEKFGSGVQHIAFLTDDIFETSERLKKLKFKRLPLPVNYYTDLETIFDLKPEMIDKLKAGNIFYDSDGKGEYFQIYSLPVFKGFFFEIVQRRNYEDYGARNAPFRIKAQMKYLQGVKCER